MKGVKTATWPKSAASAPKSLYVWPIMHELRKHVSLKPDMFKQSLQQFKEATTWPKSAHFDGQSFMN